MLHFDMKLKQKNVVKISLFFISILGLVACGGGASEDLRAYVESVKARPVGAVEPLRDPVVYDSYGYQSDSQRDPFKPSFTASKVAPTKIGSSSGGPDMTRERSQLESFPIDTLRYIGNLQQGKISWGLIKTPEGEIVRVKLGDYMGQDYGRVTSVDSENIELLELIPDGIGGWEKRTVSLVLNG
ncbi:hypothetical protein MNBD_GAMMA18-370 [hydrothermal vent metagenome]|uniref:Type IV pilus biogenesis protein PilP n=1 Tax=hydrothermal vent metagenome TaxID=652676 RepID=A0A3B0Z098_9ZZZZ